VIAIKNICIFCAINAEPIVCFGDVGSHGWDASAMIRGKLGTGDSKRSLQ
jgi:hypothetical protein